MDIAVVIPKMIVIMPEWITGTGGYTVSPFAS
jgi:hypothetical protein